MMTFVRNLLTHDLFEERLSGVAIHAYQQELIGIGRGSGSGASSAFYTAEGQRTASAALAETRSFSLFCSVPVVDPRTRTP